MISVNLKRVYNDYSESDGYRVLVDRLWPRGVKKEALHYDLWAKDLTPSGELREWFHEDPENRWIEFSKHYKRELENSEPAKKVIEELKKHKKITLLYAAKDTVHTHAKILKEFIDSKLK